MSFRTNLSHLRTAHSMTQEQLAMLLGVSRQSVTKWESGKSTPEMDKLLKLCEIFSCTLDELVCGDLSSREEQPFQPASSAPVDLCGYDEERSHFAWAISLGVGSIILGSAILCFIEAAGLMLGYSTDDADILGVLALLAFVGVGLALIIPAGIKHSAFVKAHPFVEDFYTNEERGQCQESFIRHLVGGILIILAGVGVSILFDSLYWLEPLGSGLLLGFIAVGVWSIIYGSMMWGAMDVSAYNCAAAEQAEATVGDALIVKSRRDRIAGGLCGAIMLVATIAGIVMLFVPGYTTPYFWLSWPIGALLCGVVANLTSALVKEG